MDSEAPLIGRTLAGRFEVNELLGEGAMAVVHRGVDRKSGREVAIKVLHPELSRDATVVRRFRREAGAAAALRHTNTVEVIASGVDGGLAFMVMELLAGRDLYDVLAADGRVSEARAADILAQVCDALVVAHEKGIVHRDMKPENVMIVPHPDDPSRERVIVLDFGIAKVLERGPTSKDRMEVTSTALTNVGMILGTPEYMSPEQCKASAIDARSDIYSCGVLLYQLVTGRAPFRADDPVQTMLLQVREEPAPPRSHAPDLSEAMEAVILHALQKAPADRPQSATELRREILDAVAKPVVSEPPQADQEPEEAATVAATFFDDPIRQQAEAELLGKKPQAAPFEPLGKTTPYVRMAPVIPPEALAAAAARPSYPTYSPPVSVAPSAPPGAIARPSRRGPSVGLLVGLAIVGTTFGGAVVAWLLFRAFAW